MILPRVNMCTIAWGNDRVIGPKNLLGFPSIYFLRRVRGKWRDKWGGGGCHDTMSAQLGRTHQEGKEKPLGMLICRGVEAHLQYKTDIESLF